MLEKQIIYSKARRDFTAAKIAQTPERDLSIALSILSHLVQTCPEAYRKFSEAVMLNQSQCLQIVGILEDAVYLGGWTLEEVGQCFFSDKVLQSLKEKLRDRPKPDRIAEYALSLPG